jgi:DNA-binding transcriptional regulator YiaG
VGLKKTVADLKKRLAALQKENRRLLADTRRPKAEFGERPLEEQRKVRFTSKRIRNLRSRLRLTQADFAKLVGTTPYSVHLWEKKEGPLRLRDKTREAILSIKGLRGAREAKSRLDEVGRKRKRGRKGAF